MAKRCFLNALRCSQHTVPAEPATPELPSVCGHPLAATPGGAVSWRGWLPGLHLLGQAQQRGRCLGNQLLVRARKPGQCAVGQLGPQVAEFG
jgi:hypothetical protein